MKKESLMFGILGLVLGLVLGFVGANSMNRTAGGVTPNSTAGPASPSGANPALPSGHPPLGNSAGDSQVKGSAVPQVTEAIEKAKQQPQDYEAQMTAADLYYQIQRFEEAAKFYEAAAKLNPNEAEPLIKAGNAHFDYENYLEAEKWYIRALAKDPKNLNVRNDLGLTFFLREPRDIDRAVKEYKQALVIDPELEITLQNLALAYEPAGDLTALASTVEKLKQVNPKNPALEKLSGK